MTIGGTGINGSGRGGRLPPALVLAGVLGAAIAAPATAQMFSDHPPPVPPASVPELSAPAMNLAPPSGPASIPSLPPPLTQPSIAAVPPVAPPPGAPTAGQAVLSLTARYGKDLPVINNGLVWRCVFVPPAETPPPPICPDARTPSP